MRKSSSLESLQTLMQDIQKEQLENVNPFTTPRHSTIRVSRSRETNESFRAAVDRSYDANNDNENHETMETVAEEDDSDSGSSVENVAHRPHIHHTQAILVRPSGALSMASTQYTATTATSSQLTTEDEAQGFLKKKSSGKKKRGLRTWFKFGSKKGRSSESKQKAAEREAAAAAGHQQTRDPTITQNAQQMYLLEQERIHMHYKRLMEQQQQQQLQHHLQPHSAHVSHLAQPTPPARQRSKSAIGERFGSTDRQPMHSTPTGVTAGQLANHELNNEAIMSRNERMAHLRAQHQRMHQERHRVYPNEARIYDTYSSMDRKHQSDYNNSPNYSSTQIYVSYPINPNYTPSPRRLVTSPKLDAKSTDTYRRSKKAKEEKERQLRERQHSDTPQQQPNQSVNGMHQTPQQQQPVNTDHKVVVPHELGKCRSPGSCPYHTVRTTATQLNNNNNNNNTRDVGPALGMRKSSSLESLQTLMQDIQKEQLENVNPFTTP
ncbi:unnamed protein product, partial [Medioppia subpectinata]